MRLGIKGKQVLGVTSIVGAVVVLLSLLYLGDLARVSLEESSARAELVANAISREERWNWREDPDPLSADATWRTFVRARTARGEVHA